VKWSDVTWTDETWSVVKWMKWRVRSQFPRLPLLVQLTASLYRSSSTGISWIPSGRIASENDLCPCRQSFTDMRDVRRLSESFYCLRYPDSISKLLCIVLHYIRQDACQQVTISYLTIRRRENERFGKEQQRETATIVPLSLNATLDVLFCWSTSPSLFLEIKS